ncbi:hypothetical protein C8R48DRAFT_465527 [Suillus tomentosus]|nr:hypothetical protein C8R48DRAFT_465527 [Suillus tomentosus]
MLHASRTTRHSTSTLGPWIGMAFTLKLLDGHCFCRCCPHPRTNALLQKVPSSRDLGGILLCGAPLRIHSRRCGSWIFGTGNTQRHLIVLSGTNFQPNSIDFCFLGNNRLLVVAGHLKLYSIEDMSQTPQLLACFLMPVLYLDIQCFLPMDHIDSSPQLQAQQAMYTSDPKNQLLCITAGGSRTFIISTRIFFNLEEIAAATPVPWERWGPSNTRIFEPSGEFKVHVSGNRVLQALVSTSASGDVEYTLHILDFSPLAVTNRRGLGRVVKEPSTIPEFDEWTGRPAKSLITSLPYVEVILDKRFGSAESELADVWVDKDRIYLLNTKFDHEVVGSAHYAIEYNELEVIDV